MVSNIMMAGAKRGSCNGLSENDIVLLRSFLKTLEILKIPFDHDFKPFKEASAEGNTPVDIVNTHRDHGARDFFLEQPRFDAIILCNIPKDPPAEEQDWDDPKKLYVLKERRLLEGAFTISIYHHPEDDYYNWRQKMHELNPRFILLSGSDGFEPELFMLGGRYTLLRGPGLGEGLLVSKEYLESIEAFLAIENSPLLDCVLGGHSKYFVRQDIQPFGSNTADSKSGASIRLLAA